MSILLKGVFVFTNFLLKTSSEIKCPQGLSFFSEEKQLFASDKPVSSYHQKFKQNCQTEAICCNPKNQSKIGLLLCRMLLLEDAYNKYPWVFKDKILYLRYNIAIGVSTKRRFRIHRIPCCDCDGLFFAKKKKQIHPRV